MGPPGVDYARSYRHKYPEKCFKNLTGIEIRNFFLKNSSKNL